jgi:hypothetical protein
MSGVLNLRNAAIRDSNRSISHPSGAYQVASHSERHFETGRVAQGLLGYRLRPALDHAQLPHCCQVLAFDFS